MIKRGFRINFTLLLIINIIPIGLSLQAQDSLSNLSYTTLRKNALSNGEKKDSTLSRMYGHYSLRKAKNENNLEQILSSHHLLALVENKDNSLKHMDSIILLSEGKNYKKYPLIGYYFKGKYFYNNRNFKLSLDNYLKALKYSDTASNNSIANNIQYVIGVIRSRTGDYKQALADFRKVKKNLENKEQTISYAELSFGMFTVFHKLKQLDSARIYTTEGYRISKKIKSDLYHYFELSQGIIEYEEGNYQASIDSLSKSAEYFKDIEDLPNLSFTYYYRGLSNLKQGKKIQGFNFFRKIDSIFTIIKDIHPELRNSWELLIENSKNKEKLDSELYYIKQLLTVDSILNTNYRYLNKQISTKYDIPLLISRKNYLLKKEENENKSKAYVIWILSIILIFSIFILLYLKRNQEIKELKFEQIVKDLSNKINSTTQNTLPHQSKPPTLNKEIFNTIAKRLSDLEEEKFFLKNGITINQIAKKIKTNSKYLSIYINSTYKKNFNLYINDLRVEYAVEKLENDHLFRKWTLLAIAQEIGFSSREYFTKAFKKRFGITPSYYIEKIESKNLKI